MQFQLPPDAHTIREIGGRVLVEYGEIFKKWQRIVKMHIQMRRDEIKGSRIIYMLDVTQTGDVEPKVLDVIKDLDEQVGELGRLVGTPLDLAVAAHKVDVFLKPYLNVKAKLLPVEYDPAEFRSAWNVPEVLGGTYTPPQKVYNAGIAAIQKKVDQYSELDPKPRVVALTSVFGGSFYYGNLVEAICCDKDATLIGFSKCGKTTAKNSLRGRMEKLFVPMEVKKLEETPGYEKNLTNTLSYINQVNAARGIEIVPQPIFGDVDIFEAYDYVFAQHQLQKFISDPSAKNYEGTGFVRGPAYRIKKG